MRVFKSYKINLFVFVNVVLNSVMISDVVYAQEQTVVALFGDSITVGRLNSPFPDFGSSRSPTGFGSGKTNFGNPDIQLSAILNDSNRPSIVVNWGNSGSSTDNGALRISDNLAQTKGQHEGTAYYVLIMYGTNDSDYGLSSSDTAFNVGLMIDRARGQGYIPVVSNLTNRADQPSQVAARNSTIASVVASRGAPFVNQFSIFNAAGGLSLTYDGLHPNPTGYGVIAQGWFNSYLKNAIEEKKVPVVPVVPVAPVVPIVPMIMLLLLDDENKNPVVAPMIMLLLDDDN